MPFAIGSKVWLEVTNLKLPSNLTPKLAPKHYGPFKVTAQVSKVAYCLLLPTHWKIHNVFHASLLTPYCETDHHSPNFLEPPPDIIEGEPEWEVEKILQERTFGQWKKKQYLVQWKGYSPSHDEWIPEEDLHTLDLLAEFCSSSSSIRTLKSNVSSACSLLPPTFTHHCQTSLPVYTTMNNNSMESPSTPESTRQDMSLPTILPFSHQENSTPTSLTPSAPSNPITRSSAGVQSPLIHTDNLSTSSTSPLPICPPSLAAPLLLIPSVTTVISSQDKILLDINPPLFPTPQHTLLSAGTLPGLVSLFRSQEENPGLAMPSISESHRQRTLERTQSHCVLSIGERSVSPAAISIVNTDEEMELLNSPHCLTNTPTDAPTETSTPPPG